MERLSVALSRPCSNIIAVHTWVHPGSSGTTNSRQRQTEPPPWQECRGVWRWSKQGVHGNFVRCKKKWHLDGFPLWNLFLAPSDDVGREVERWSFAAADTDRGTAPGIGWPQLWLWDWQLVQLEEHWRRGLDCSTGNGGRSSRDRACSGSHNKHISWSASITSSSCFSKCSSVPGHFLLASPNGDPAGKMPTLESMPLHTSTDFCFSFWFFMHGAEIGMLKLMSS